jgi:toxin ParE1/3/4
LIAAARFYNQRVPGLGADFLGEVNQGVMIILEKPNRWRQIEAGIRRYSIKRFPYTLFYRIELDKVRILAVKHHRRHPDYWKHRKET